MDDPRGYPDLVDSVESFLNLAGNWPLLTVEEEYSLAKKIKLDDQSAKNRLVESNLRLVVSVAKAYRNKEVPLPDLIQEGITGLIRATDTFDPEKGCRFSTYAVAWIRQAITRAIERQRRAIRVPTHVFQGVRNIRKAKSKYLSEHGREPSLEELSMLTKITEDNINFYLEASSVILSLDEGYEDDDGPNPLLSRLTEENIVNPEEDALKKEDLVMLQQLMKWLSPQEKLIIEKRFGLGNDGVKASLQKIGNQLHITRERVRQLEARALKKLRMAVVGQRLDNYFDR